MLYEQFKYFLNMFYLIMALSQLIPQLRVGSLLTYWVPLVSTLLSWCNLLITTSAKHIMQLVPLVCLVLILNWLVFTMQAQLCNCGLGSLNSDRLSLPLSVCLSDAWIVTELNDALQIF